MKKIFIAGVFILFAVITQAQNVGIGIPMPVARLQINHRSGTAVGLFNYSIPTGPYWRRYSAWLCVYAYLAL